MTTVSRLPSPDVCTIHSVTGFDIVSVTGNKSWLKAGRQESWKEVDVEGGATRRPENRRSVRKAA
jgi:hypothetical protein